LVSFIGLVEYTLLQCSFIIECIHGHYGYNCEESCDGCLLDREHGVCTDTTACKPGKQSGLLKKCDKGIEQSNLTIFKNCLLTINATSSVLYQSIPFLINVLESIMFLINSHMYSFLMILI
jgi:hypothetical protein